MREKITIRRVDREWKLTIPGFGFNTPTEKTFTRWPDAMAYVDNMPLGSSGSHERAGHNSDGIGARPPWSPLQWL
jgi:hypothetical protein